MYRQFVKNCNRFIYCQLLGASHKSCRVDQRTFKTSLKNHSKFSILGTKSRGLCTSATLRENWLQHTRRLANPDSINRNEYVESLCLSLHDSRPDRYRFFEALAKKRRTLLAIDSGANEDAASSESEAKLFAKEEHEQELLELIKMFGKDEVEQKCLEKFQSWADKSKLSIAYTLYANNLKCDEFLTRLVRHLAPQIEVLQPEEFVALLLVIYLSKSWSPEELYDVLDPTELQLRFARLIRNREMSNVEICVACHGLKKIEGFVAKEFELRQALYTRAISIARDIYGAGESSYIDDMTILHISVLLRQGNLVTLDKFKLVDKFLTAFVPVSHLLEPRTIAKIMAFGLVKNYHNPELTSEVLSRILRDGDISGLSLKDICSLLKFIVMINLDEVVNAQEKAVLVDIIVQELNSMMDEGCSLTDVTSLLQSWSYLAQYQYFETSKLEKLFSTINEIMSDDQVDQMSQHELSLAACEATYKALFPISFIQARPDLEAAPKHLVSSLTRNIASLDQTLAVFSAEFKAEHGIRPKILASLIKMNQTAVVVANPSKSQLQKSFMTRRQRIFASIYKELIEILGDGYVKMVHVLPHYQEPDIIFGHIGGIKLTVPEKFSDLEFSASLKPAPNVGDWYVITAESRYFHEVSEDTKSEWVIGESQPITDKFQVSDTAEPFKHRQLKNLGYNIVVVNENEMQRYRTRRWTQKTVASILTGLDQPPPNPKSVPVM